MDSFVIFNTPKFFKFSRQALTEQNAASSLVQSLSEVKRFCSTTKLTTEHPILIAIVSSYSKSLRFYI
jgi:hypothetical protein